MNILIIRFSSLGDVIMATAVVEAISRKIPEATIHFLTKSMYSQIFESDERVENIVGIQGGENPLEIVRMLGKKTFDTVVDLHSSMRSIAVASLLRSPMKLRVAKHSLARRLMVWSHNRFRYSFDTLGNYFDTIRPLITAERVLPRIIPPGEARKTAETILAGIKKGDANRFIGFAPGSKHPTKRWTEKSFACLADETARRGYIPLFIGDKSDIDVIIRIRDIMEKESVTLAGKINLSVTIALISKLNFLVTNDSGPMHIAGALGTPFVAIFGPTHPDLGFAPGYPYGKILHSGAACSPCSVHGESPCRMSSRVCMEEITCKMVMKEIENISEKILM